MRLGNWQQTFMGVAFYPADPRRHEVLILDVAHALAHQCRFGGHCQEFYSVAQHSLHVELLLRKRGNYCREVLLGALLHDATEAYLVDLPRPVKLMLPDYQEMERRLHNELRSFFGFMDHEDIKWADEVALATEKRDLMSPEPLPWGRLPSPDPERIQPVSPATAKVLFLDRFNQLYYGFDP